MQKTKKIRKFRGLSAHMLILPATAIIVFLYATLVFRSTRIDHVKERLFENSEAYITATQTYDDFRRNVTKMTDQAGLFFVTEGDPQYAEAFCDRAEQFSVLASETENLSAQTVANAGTPALWEELVELEARAMKLFALGSEVELTDAKHQRIMSATLSDEEIGMTAAQQRETAAKLLHGEECYTLRGRVMDSVDELHGETLAKTTERFEELSKILNCYTSGQGVFTTALCAFLIFVLGFLYIMLLLPLMRATQRVQNGEEIGIRHGVLELRSFSEHYDRMIEKKTILEDDLRQSAHLDTLTGLPNRLAEKQYISLIRRKKSNLPMAVFSFDVNNLKPTNDTQGHVVGDMLLQKAAQCILKCFGDEMGQNCFRIGGDEFVAILQDVTEAELRERVKEFERRQREADISVAVGYAYSDEIHPVDVAELFQRADRNMYQMKSEMKRRMATDSIAAADPTANDLPEERS